MNLRLLLALVALTFLGSFNAAFSAPTHAAITIGEDEELLAAALKDFERAASRPSFKDRTATLKALVALGNEDAMPSILIRLASAAKAVQKAENDLEVNQIMLERRKVQLAQMELAVERGKPLEDRVKGFKENVAARKQNVAKAKQVLKKERPWYAELRGGIGDLVNAQPTGKRRSIVKELWKVFEKGDKPQERLIAAKVLVDFGEKDTAKRFAKVLSKVLSERAKLKRGLAPLEEKVRGWERKLQDEQKKFGTAYQSTDISYRQVQGEAKRYNDLLIDMEQFGTGLVDAAGSALALELEPLAAAKDLMKMARKSPHQEQLIEVFVKSKLRPMAELLAAELNVTKEDKFKQILVDALASMGAREEAEPWLLTKGLFEEYWLLRSCSATALGKLRSRAAIPILIGRLDIEEGRPLTQVTAALESLTGENFHGRKQLWERWWNDQEASFKVSPDAPPSSEAKALDAVGEGTSFFGLHFDSQRVLFVLDVSGSMNEEMTTYVNAKGGETRFTVAKRELLKALNGIREGGTFNIQLYATDVWTWSEEPVVMDPDTRLEAIEFINELEVGGGTNLYGAVKVSLAHARGDAKSKGRGAPQWIEPVYDTIFLLSDGAPSQGLSTDRDDILDMALDENANLGVTINTIGLSMGQDVVLMRNLAEQTGGTYVAR